LLARSITEDSPIPDRVIKPVDDRCFDRGDPRDADVDRLDGFRLASKVIQPVAVQINKSIVEVVDAITVRIRVILVENAIPVEVLITDDVVKTILIKINKRIDRILDTITIGVSIYTIRYTVAIQITIVLGLCLGLGFDFASGVVYAIGCGFGFSLVIGFAIGLLLGICLVCCCFFSMLL